MGPGQKPRRPVFSQRGSNGSGTGKKLDLLAFLDFHQPQIVAIQETKIDSSISTSELFPESCPYNVYRKDQTLDGGAIMLLIHPQGYFAYAHHRTGK